MLQSDGADRFVPVDVQSVRLTHAPSIAFQHGLPSFNSGSNLLRIGHQRNDVNAAQARCPCESSAGS